MTTLVVGATGATGRLLIRDLLNRGLNVKVIVRSPDKLPEDIRAHERLSVTRANVLDLSSNELAQVVDGCGAVASCLGHNLNLRGIYGQPRMLVTDSVRRLCDAIKSTKPAVSVRFVLMNTAGNSNRDIPERLSFAESSALALLRLLTPPLVDSEKSADYLRTMIGKNDRMIEWVVVRPDTLTDESEVTRYDLHPSPIRSAIFNAGVTSRINVGHFMADLMTKDELWNQWKGQMPVIYNKVPVQSPQRIKPETSS
ncbi:MAG: SDR family oxidoreductase [Anaerolineae bacterium]|nr:SDR family oxidoreductase [Anaerolineae bacterium]